MPLYDQITLDMRHDTNSTISKFTVVAYLKSFRDICVSYFQTRLVSLDSPGEIVKIDETILTWKKITPEGLFPSNGVSRAPRDAPISASLWLLITEMQQPSCFLSDSMSFQGPLSCRTNGQLIMAFKSYSKVRAPNSEL